MDKEIKEIIGMYEGITSKFYIYLKYLLTPFLSIDDSLPRQGRILDIGCGTGAYSIYLYLKSKKRSVCGLDRDSRRIKYAKNITSRIKNLEFRHIDLNGKYSIPSCEAYLINDVLHHIPDKSKKWILKSVFSSMPYNGVLVIKDMSFRSKIKFFLNYLNDIIMTRNDKLYFISRERLTKMLQDIGFKIKAKELKGYAFPHIIYTCRKIT
ncbi:class I SAM-dependent methyltransferase [Candidatus Woesearchaeota archaeon]|nr:class I SAM-dependent methyltransferase [Candidatus Woesearchaeota archaeon]